MHDPRDDRVVFTRCALFVAALGLLANQWVLRALSPDGSLEDVTRSRIWMLQGALLALALALHLGRGRWTRLFAHERRPLFVILLAAIALRVVLFPFLGPDNNDPHRDVVEYVVEHGWTPTADQATLGFQPPLYYLIAAPWALGGSAKQTQLLSLLLSIANLVVLYRILSTTRLLQDPRARCHAFLLAAFLGQFALFGLFVSNDALAFLLGTLIFGQMALYVERPTPGRLLGLGCGLGAGLLTKGTFTAFLPPAFALVFVLGLQRRLSLQRHAGNLALLAIPALGLGSYKFVENAIHFGTPVVDNDTLEQEWVKRQQGTVQGLESFVDVDLPRLIQHPYASEETQHSLPLLFYGTFWYSYIHESNLDTTRRYPWGPIPQVLYATGALTTLVMLIGLAVWLARNARLAASFRAPQALFQRRLLETAIVATLLFNLAAVLSWGIKHDAWSFFQSRLLFPAFLALALLLGWGFEAVRGRFPRTALALNLALLSPWLVSLAWLGVEVAGQLGSGNG